MVGIWERTLGKVLTIDGDTHIDNHRLRSIADGRCDASYFALAVPSSSDNLLPESTKELIARANNEGPSLDAHRSLARRRACCRPNLVEVDIVVIDEDDASRSESRLRRKVGNVYWYPVG